MKETSEDNDTLLTVERSVLASEFQEDVVMPIADVVGTFSC
jgi:hypothetical protein